MAIPKSGNVDHYQVEIKIGITGVNSYGEQVGANIATLHIEKSVSVTRLTDLGFLLEYIEKLPTRKPDQTA